MHIRRLWHKVRTVKRGVRNVLFWLPVMWDADWFDWSVLIVLLDRWLEYIQANEANMVTRWYEREGKNIRYTRLLCKRILGGLYGKPSGFSTMTWRTYGRYMEQQDMDQLADMLRKHLMHWWD